MQNIQVKQKKIYIFKVACSSFRLVNTCTNEDINKLDHNCTYQTSKKTANENQSLFEQYLNSNVRIFFKKFF